MMGLNSHHSFLPTQYLTIEITRLPFFQEFSYKSFKYSMSFKTTFIFTTPLSQIVHIVICNPATPKTP